MSSLTICVLIHRHVPDEPELVAEFKYIDMAEVTARALCEQFKYDVSIVNGDAVTQYGWRKKEVENVTIVYKREIIDDAA